MAGMSTEDSGAAFSFKGIKVEDAGAGALPNSIGFSPEEDNWTMKGYENSRLLAFKEDGQMKKLEDGRDDTSVGKARASAYLFCCCFYNCCCCCLSNIVPSIGPLCGNQFCCKGATCLEVRFRRDRWLGILHTVCFCVHITFAIMSFSAGAGKPMEVDIFRVVPSWNNTGRNGYNYVVEKDFQIRIDTVTGLFFLLSAIFHFVWMFSSIFLPRVWEWMISYIDECLCFWRFIEYSLSASLMLMSIGMITGLRNGYSMFGVFMLSFTTMVMGIITEMLSRPESPDKWKGDPDPVPWADFTLGYFVIKFRSYMWRMFPHFVGWFPYLAAWFIVLSNFFRQIYDLPTDLQDRIPWFVPWAIYGTAVTFTTFAFVQIRFQWTAPKHYWRTEVWYCFLSLTAKLYLGSLLYWNIILADSFEEAIALDNPSTSSNATMPLVRAWHQAVRLAESVG